MRRPPAALIACLALAGCGGAAAREARIARAIEREVGAMQAAGRAVACVRRGDVATGWDCSQRFAARSRLVALSIQAAPATGVVDVPPAAEGQTLDRASVGPGGATQRHMGRTRDGAFMVVTDDLDTPLGPGDVRTLPHGVDVLNRVLARYDRAR